MTKIQAHVYSDSQLTYIAEHRARVEAKRLKVEANRKAISYAPTSDITSIVYPSQIKAISETPIVKRFHGNLYTAYQMVCPYCNWLMHAYTKHDIRLAYSEHINRDNACNRGQLPKPYPDITSVNRGDIETRLMVYAKYPWLWDKQYMREVAQMKRDLAIIKNL